MTITINRKCLLAVAPFMSKETERFYFCGVFLGNGCLTATDGHRLATVHPNQESCIPETETGIIVPSKTVKSILAVKPSDKKLPMYVSFTQDRIGVDERANIWAARVFHKPEMNLVSIPFNPIQGYYPDYRRVIPRVDALSGVSVPTGFNPEHLGSFASFGNDVCLFLNKSEKSPALFRAETVDFSAVGVLMPMRLSFDLEKSRTLPD